MCNCAKLREAAESAALLLKEIESYRETPYEMKLPIKVVLRDIADALRSPAPTVEKAKGEAK